MACVWEKWIPAWFSTSQKPVVILQTPDSQRQEWFRTTWHRDKTIDRGTRSRRQILLILIMLMPINTCEGVYRCVMLKLKGYPVPLVPRDDDQVCTSNGNLTISLKIMNLLMLWLLLEDSLVAVVELQVVAGVSAKVWSSLRAEETLDTDILHLLTSMVLSQFKERTNRVLVEMDTIAGVNRHKLAVFTSVASGIVASLSTCFVDDVVEDGAEEVMVLWVASVL